MSSPGVRGSSGRGIAEMLKSHDLTVMAGAVNQLYPSLICRVGELLDTITNPLYILMITLFDCKISALLEETHLDKSIDSQVYHLFRNNQQ